MSDDKLNQDKARLPEDDNSLPYDLDLDNLILDEDIHAMEGKPKPESDPAPAGKVPAGGRGKKVLLWGGGALAAAGLLGSFGFAAVQVLSPGKPAVQQHASAYSTETQPGVGETHSGFGNQGAIAPFGNEAPTLPEQQGDAIPTNAWAVAGGNDQDTTSGNHVTEIEEAVELGDVLADQPAIHISSGLPQAQEDTAEQHVSLTEEEQMYDRLLLQADTLSDVPVEAIRIDQSVINRQLDAKRIKQLEETVVSTRESVSQMNESIAGIRGMVIELSEQVEADQADTKAVYERLEQLDAAVSDLSKDRSAEIDALVSRVTNAERQAQDAAKAAKKAAEDATAVVARSAARPTPAAAPRQPAPAPVKAVAQAPAAPPKPAAKPDSSGLRVTKTTLPPNTPVATVTAPAPVATPTKVQDTQEGSCEATRVSSVWRVMGVNETSAYITRAQDRAGLLVRVGTEIPGFGNAVSFDPKARALCTTSGLIQR